jgi:hypothetical protein
VLHSLVIDDDHHKVNGLSSKVQPEAAPGHGNGCGCTPSAVGSAGRDTFSVIAAEADGNLDH